MFRTRYVYNQAPHSKSIIPDNVLSHQIKGGWNPEDGVVYKDINQQIDQAFANVELALKDAQGKGWSQVFKVISYHLPLNEEALEAMLRNFKRYMPDHKPIWSCVGVTRLALDDMRIEIEVVAHDPEGNSDAK